MGMRVYAVCNCKGGVGKTTTVVEIPGHREGRFLICDMDPQGNASKMLLGKNPKDISPNIYDVIVHPDTTDLGACIYRATESFPNVWVMPCNKRLDAVERELSGPKAIGFEKRLSKQLERLESNFDFVLIDTGPQPSMLTYMAIRASNCVLIPTDISVASHDGINDVLEIIDDLRKADYNVDYRIVGTMAQKRNSTSFRRSRDVLINQYGDKYFDNVDIPHCTKVADSMWHYDPPRPTSTFLHHNHKLYRGYESLANRL